eukprot:UN05089
MSELNQVTATGTFNGKETPHLGGTIKFQSNEFNLYYNGAQNRIYWIRTSEQQRLPSKSYWVRDPVSEIDGLYYGTSRKSSINRVR